MEPSSLEERLAFMEARLSRIEGRIGMRPLQQPVAPGPWDAAQHGHTPTPNPNPKPLMGRPGDWLGIIAVICFVVAAGFIVKLSIDSGWLTPMRQVGLPTLLGFSLIGAGFALLKSDRAYASLLPGAGVIVLYLSVFAAHRLYALMPFDTAICLTGVVSAICIWLYTQIRHDAYPITAAMGAYLAPVVLGFDTVAVFTLYVFLLCSAAFASISIWLKSRMLILVSSYLAILMSAYVGMDLLQHAFVAMLLGIHFLIFTAGIYAYSTHHQSPLTENECRCFLPILVLFYAVEYEFLSRMSPQLAPVISLAFAMGLGAIYLLARKQFSQRLPSEELVVVFATIAAFHSLYLELLPDWFCPWLVVIVMVGFILLPKSTSERSATVVVKLPALAILIILAIEYVSILGHVLQDSRDGNWLAVSLAAIASMWMVLTMAKDKLLSHAHWQHALLGAVHVLSVVVLFEVTNEISSLAVSASWLFYGVAVLLLAYLQKDSVTAKSALFILAFAAGKALLYDAASAPTIIRILCLLLTGAVLYGCGLFVRRLSSWERAKA